MGRFPVLAPLVRPVEMKSIRTPKRFNDQGMTGWQHALGSKLPIVLLAALVSIASSPASAQTSVSSANIADVAGGVWDTRFAGVYDHQTNGYEAASDGVPGRWTQLFVAAEPGIEVARGNLGEADQMVYGSATMNLGDTPATTRAMWDAAARASESARDAARARFVLEAERSFIDWNAAALVEEHLQEDVDAYRAEVEAFDAALEAHAISRLDHLDLQADLARLEMELLDAQQDAADARAALIALLGRDILPDVSRLDQLPGRFDNPWETLAGRATGHPELQAMESRAEALRAQAEQSALNPAQLGFGPVLHVENSGFTWVSASVQLTIPLQNTGLAQSIQMHAAADSLDMERNGRSLAWEAFVQGEAERYATLLAHYEALDSEIISLLSERADLVREAVESGQSTVERLIRARRELHEAEHHRILLAAQVYRSQALAARLSELLDMGETP